MAWTFSKRCAQALKEKKIEVSIPLKVRTRLLTCLNKFDENFYVTDDSGFNYTTSFLRKLPASIEAELGISTLLSFPEEGSGPPEPSNLSVFILRGNYPPLIFDILELFYSEVSSMEEGRKDAFQSEINNIMEESNLAWRMANGKIFPVDSRYIQEHIINQTYELLHDQQFYGALEEFEKARTDIANENNEGAIQNANLAIESAIKTILGVKKSKPGKLYQQIIEKEFIPKYFNGFLECFEEYIMRSPAIIRNEEPGAGHGRGNEKIEIPKSLAELAINLTAVMINYLIKRHIEKSS
ncbi:MAG: abortive infection family protein [Candidatus Ratteibacteria bacterium]|jgi:hypothetical protein